MSDERAPDSGNFSESGANWPVEFRGVTESLVTTLGPNDRWNVAALGLHPPDDEDGADAPVTARTWGNTRTRRNFHRQGGGYVQFTRNPVDFVDATLSIYEVENPVLGSADAWVEVEAEQVGSGESGGTEWEAWELRPRESHIERETVPTVNRGFPAVVEATIAASRLGVEAYDETELRNRLDYFEEVARKCGDEQVCVAMDRLEEYVAESG